MFICEADFATSHAPNYKKIALASGFNSAQNFNDCFKMQLKLIPSRIQRRSDKKTKTLFLDVSYRPPFDWPVMQSVLAARAISTLEWCNEDSYGRTFAWNGCVGSFTAKHIPNKNLFKVKIELCDVKHLKVIVSNIKRILDVDVDMEVVERDLKKCLPEGFVFNNGVRIPGIWSMFEAGIRAILGQQISVVAARNLVSTLVSELGEQYGSYRLFPTPKVIAYDELNFLKIPASRKQALRNLAKHYLTNLTPDDPNQWLTLKGIGPWTVDYAKMRGLSHTDIFLNSDLGIKKILKKPMNKFKSELASPWRSYLTFQLWSQL